MSIQIIDEVNPHEFNRCFIGICPYCDQGLLRAVELTRGGFFVECRNGCTFDQISSKPSTVLAPISYDNFIDIPTTIQDMQNISNRTNNNENASHKMDEKGKAK